MCIYCGTKNYHKIYKNHYGAIPREPDGRIYEIHHIDGNHSNNDPANLTAITLEEHYNIHYTQGDYGACYWMAVQRMNKSHAELSELASKRNSIRNKKYVELGIHNFLGGEIQRKWNQEAVKKGTHHALGPRLNKMRLDAGTHNLTGPLSNQSRLDKGTHPSQIKISCLCCREVIATSMFKRWHGDKCKQKSAP